MKYSITQKITLIMISIVAGTVLLCWFINTTLLESYYVEHKQKILLDLFEMVDQESAKGRTDDEDFLIRLEKQSTNSNISMMIISSDRTIMYTNVGDDERMLVQFLELIFHTKNQHTKILESTQQYTVEKTIDNRLQSDYLVLWGSLQNGNMILMRSAVESIKESVAIANRFLSYVGVIAVIMCAVIIYMVTKKITNPILQLAEISRRMTDLEFDVKFQSKGKNEIDLLGEHMNQMSETLEKTISELASKKTLTKPSKTGVIVEGIDNCLVKLSKCCNPLPGDQIVGYITKGRGVSVHRADCININDLLSEENRMIDVYWAGEVKTSYNVDIAVYANDRQGLLADVIKEVTAAKFNIMGVNTKTTKERIAIIEITVELENIDELNKLIRTLRKVDSVYDVKRNK